MRIIGIDLGEKNIGVAVSDETGTIATALGRIRPAGPGELITAVKDIVTKYAAQEVVVGLPLNMDGSTGRAAESVMDFVDKLKGSLSAVVSTFDERLTTKQGEAILISADMSRKKRKAKIDKLAAQIMLQTYLDFKKKE